MGSVTRSDYDRGCFWFAATGGDGWLLEWLGGGSAGMSRCEGGCFGWFSVVIGDLRLLQLMGTEWMRILFYTVQEEGDRNQ